MTLSQLNATAALLRSKIEQMNRQMERINDPDKLVAHSEKIVALQVELERIEELISRSN